MADTTRRDPEEEQRRRDREDPEAQPAGGFRVTDRRRIRLEASGELPDDASARAQAAGHTMGEDNVAQAGGIPEGAPGIHEEQIERPSEEDMASAEDAANSAAAQTQRRPPPPMDFVTFILSLGSSAMVHLGETPHPDTGRPEVNLVMAKQTIDMLAMLQEKTRGNLGDEEQAYLDALLYDLRLRFVDATRQGRGARS